MNLQSILTPDCTVCAAEGISKKRVFEKICSIAKQRISQLSEHDLLSSLNAREKMGSTGIGNGIAIPHGRLSETEEVIAVVITTKSPVEFDAIDNRPVDIFIALFVPEDSCKEHLSTLQSIAKLFSDKSMGKQVRKCTSDQALYDLIQQHH